MNKNISLFVEKIPNFESVYETFSGLVQNIRNFDMDNEEGTVQLKKYEVPVK